MKGEFEIFRLKKKNPARLPPADLLKKNEFRSLKDKENIKGVNLRTSGRKKECGG